MLKAKNAELEIRNQELVTINAELVARIKNWRLLIPEYRIKGFQRQSEAANIQLAARKKMYADLNVELDAKMKKLKTDGENKDLCL
ncbi:hypothetical protein Glove_21g243 [Diversispora epigaea]|uniref:Uncharacterized protein n=1 Tax=Diversispora epigaea TaxID=1348612 RepID=A0A397JUU1_9GLOM|nr:hypothetical protein Glove_21g243 [Diversispora epigaea]